MTFWKQFLALAAASTAAAIALPPEKAASESATIIDCSVSSVSGGRAVAICPAGDADTLRLEMTLRDAFSNPLVGFPAESICIECPGVSPKICADAPTDSAGKTTLTYAAGGIQLGGWCQFLPLTLHAGASTCQVSVSPTNPSLRFFDLNASGVVGPVNFATFGLCWLQSTVACQMVNYDNGVATPLVGPVDFAIFGIHWLD